MEVCVVLFVRVTDHVEITTKHPRSSRRNRERLKVIMEIRPKIRDGGGIYVSSVEGFVKIRGCKKESEGMTGARRGNTSEGAGRPSSKDPTRSLSIRTMIAKIQAVR
jgi:hypothetical protein